MTATANAATENVTAVIDGREWLVSGPELAALIRLGGSEAIGGGDTTPAEYASVELFEKYAVLADNGMTADAIRERIAADVAAATDAATVAAFGVVTWYFEWMQSLFIF